MWECSHLVPKPPVFAVGVLKPRDHNLENKEAVEDDTLKLIDMLKEYKKSAFFKDQRFKAEN